MVVNGIQFETPSIDQLTRILELPSNLTFRPDLDVLARKSLETHLEMWLSVAEPVLTQETTERPAECHSTDTERVAVSSSE